jgi:hypothetical protein
MKKIWAFIWLKKSPVHFYKIIGPQILPNYWQDREENSKGGLGSKTVKTSEIRKSRTS